MGEKGKKQTFIVEVIEQQKDTWQGQVYWVQEDKKKPFRSVLEMLSLIDSAISPRDSGGQQEKDVPGKE